MDASNMSKATRAPGSTLEKSTDVRLRKQLECPICYYTCLPPIYMCSNGHIVCSECREKINSCSVCREKGRPKIRNLFAEQTSVNIKLPCKNKDDGCKGVFNVDDMKEHLPKCHKQFKYTCNVFLDWSGALFYCNFHGCRSELVAHVEASHPSMFCTSDKFELLSHPTISYQLAEAVPPDMRSLPIHSSGLQRDCHADSSIYNNRWYWEAQRGRSLTATCFSGVTRAPGSTTTVLEKTTNDTLRKQLDCPICFHTCLPPIYMCSNGHIVCSVCREKINSCSVCQEEGRPKIRNLFAEQTSVNINVPCENTDDGCNAVFNMEDMKKHLLKCRAQFKYTCNVFLDWSGALFSCNFRGSRSELVAHVETKHKTMFCTSGILEFSIDPTIGYQLPTAVSPDIQPLPIHPGSPRLVKAHDQYFWCVFRKSCDMSDLTAFAWYVGCEKAATRFKVRIKIVSEDGQVTVEHTGPLLHRCKRIATHRVLVISTHCVEMYTVDGMVKCKIEILKE